MNQAYLRPPIPWFRWLGAFCAPLVVWGVLHVWMMTRTPFEQLYWWPYLVSGMKVKVSQTPEPHALYSERLAGRVVPLGKAAYEAGTRGHFVLQSLTPREFHGWLFLNVYEERTATEMLLWPSILAGMLGAMLAGGGYWLDLHRHFKFRSSFRLISGPQMVTPREFSRRVQGDGIGIRLDRRELYGIALAPWMPPVIRIERALETQHLQFIGDNGAGKTSAILSITDEAEALGETCVIYDPDRVYLRRYYNPERGDVILGLDERAAGWNPADEIDWSSESTAEATALAQAASLYPGHPGQRDWFFTSVARDIMNYCMTHYGPNAEQLAELYSHADPLIDHVVKGTAMEETLMKNSSGTRPSIMGTLTTNILGTLRQIRTPDAEHPGWAAREWGKHRRGWLFFTSTEETRVACSPLQRLWIDSVIREMLSQDETAHLRLPRVRVILDELWTLGELGQLSSAMARGRKFGFTMVLGFQGRAQVKAIYGEEAESIFSAPYTKLPLRTGEPEAARWVSDLIGKRVVERVLEHRSPDGKRSYTFGQPQEEPVVHASELMGVKNRIGYLRYENYVVRMKVGIAPKRKDRTVGYIPRRGDPPKILPMPNLEELRAKDAAEKAKAAQKAANFIYDPKAEAAVQRRRQVKRRDGFMS